MFSKRLKDLRLDRGFTQKQLATLIGYDQSMIVRWENGSSEPTANAIIKLASVFNVTSDYLLGIEN